MSQIRLGTKWGTGRDDLGGIYSFMHRQTGDTVKTGGLVMTNNQEDEITATAQDLTMESILKGGDESTVPVPAAETVIDVESAKSEIIGMLQYSSSDKIEAAFNAMADLMALPPASRKMERDSKVMWMLDNLGNIPPDGAVSIYRMLAKS